MELEEKPAPILQHSWDRKPSDMKAMGDFPTDDQGKAGKNEKALNSSTDVDGSSVTIMRIQHPDTMVFPAVTLCPMTKFTKSKIFMTDDDAMFEPLGLDLPVCNATAHVRNGRPCGEALLCCCASHVQDIPMVLSNCTDEYKRELLEVIRKDKKSFDDKKFQEAYGPDLQRNLTCRFGSLDSRCSNEDFLPTVTELGLCFTFNSGQNGKEIRKVSRSDSAWELHVELDLHLDDHLAGFLSEGIFVIIHDQGVYINSADTVLVAPGSYVRINVKRKVYRNKKRPYETECTDSKRLAGFPKYDSDGCYEECLSNTTAKKCGCRLPSLVGSELISGTQCECPLACDVVKYETKTSAAAYPNPSLINYLKMKGVDKTDDYLRKNLIMLEVGYTSVSYEHFKQTAQYDSTALMGEIGGTLGLFLGCSAVTVIEFVDFAIYLCYIRNKKNS
ncbi:Acid-sensing ion channel 5 [Stylophora pistillata]|uniref:Acid-sensing ion channel 5 n=1 Tax=Stylophora pistillata TaxID=50429 RepID=A0A2B4STJ8_STYPI|nr:Acid-sensing ion channel 5 [Stylophora pistillata]